MAWAELTEHPWQALSPGHPALLAALQIPEHMWFLQGMTFIDHLLCNKLSNLEWAFCLASLATVVPEGWTATQGRTSLLHGGNG